MNENSLRDDVFVMHLTNKEMAEKYHTSISSVKVRLNKFNIKRSRISITESQQRHKIPDAAYEILNDKDRFVSFLCEHKNLSAVDMAGLIGVEPNCIYKRAHQYGVRHIINRFSSSVEKSLCDFLLSIGVSSVKNRSLLGRLEVDCYCPDYKIGIEVNGTLSVLRLFDRFSGRAVRLVPFESDRRKILEVFS